MHSINPSIQIIDQIIAINKNTSSKYRGIWPSDGFCLGDRFITQNLIMPNPKQ